MDLFYAAPVESLPAGVVRAFLRSWRGPRYLAYVPRDLVVLLMQQVYTRVRRNLGHQNPLRKHPARVLCGADWEPLPKGQKSGAGMFLAFLAANGYLPLKLHVTPSGSGSKTYWITF